MHRLKRPSVVKQRGSTTSHNNGNDAPIFILPSLVAARAYSLPTLDSDVDDTLFGSPTSIVRNRSEDETSHSRRSSVNDVKMDRSNSDGGGGGLLTRFRRKSSSSVSSRARSRELAELYEYGPVREGQEDTGGLRKMTDETDPLAIERRGSEHQPLIVSGRRRSSGRRSLAALPDKESSMNKDGRTEPSNDTDPLDTERHGVEHHPKIISVRRRSSTKEALSKQERRTSAPRISPAEKDKLERQWSDWKKRHTSSSAISETDRRSGAEGVEGGVGNAADGECGPRRSSMVQPMTQQLLQEVADGEEVAACANEQITRVDGLGDKVDASFEHVLV